MFNDYKKKHPSYDAFLAENHLGMKQIYNAIDVAFNLYNGSIRPSINRLMYKGDISDLDNSIIKRLNANTLNAIKNHIDNKNTFMRDELCNLRECHRKIGEFDLHVFGFMKLGEKSRNDLDEDIEMLHSNSNNITRSDLFDFTSCIHVGLFFNKDGIRYNLNHYESSHVHFSFDISCVLVRMLTQGALKNDIAITLDAMVNVILNKMIMWECVRATMIKAIFDNTSYDVRNTGNRDSISHIDLLKFLTIYKTFYNGINEINVDNGLSIKEALTKLDLNLAGMNFNNGLMCYMNSVYDKLNNNFFDEKRQIDKDIDYYFDLVRFILRESYVVKPNGNIATNNMINNYGLVARLKSEDASCESVINEIESFVSDNIYDSYYMDAYESFNTQVDKTFIDGCEAEGVNVYNLIPLDYEEFVKKSRSYSLMKLKSSQKKLFLEYENEVLKLKSDINNCRTPEVQRSLIDRSTSISKRINIDLSRSSDEFFDGMLILLDTLRVKLTDELASMDYKRMRNTMLYGNLKTKTNFDY